MRPPNPPDLTTFSGRFAARLRRLRERRNLTVAEVAEVLGVSDQAVYHWESGHHQPAIALLPALAKLFGMASPRSVIPEE